MYTSHFNKNITEKINAQEIEKNISVAEDSLKTHTQGELQKMMSDPNWINKLDSKDKEAIREGLEKTNSIKKDLQQSQVFDTNNQKLYRSIFSILKQPSNSTRNQDINLQGQGDVIQENKVGDVTYLYLGT